MLRRMVGCVSSGSGNNRGSASSSSNGSSTSTRVAQAEPPPQPAAVLAEPRKEPGRTSRGAAPAGAPKEPAPSTNSTTAPASPAPAWKDPSGPRTSSSKTTGLDLEARRAAERQFITANDSTETDVWYLIDVDWLSSWKRFVLRNGPLPGPISNETLLNGRSGKPRPGLELVNHYRGVNAGIWRFWVQRYGGGPVIKRHQLDMYADVVADSSSYGADSAWEEAGELPEPPQQLAQSASPAAPGNGYVVPLGADPQEAASSGTSVPSADRGSTERAEDKQGKASSRRSFSDLIKGYRGGGRSSRSQTGPTTSKAASDTSRATATAPSNGAQAPRSKPDAKSAEVGGIGDADAIAASSSSASSEPEGMIFLVKEAEACVVAQPMDGSCLFHSLSYGIDDGSDAASLRIEISNYIAGNPDMVIAGTALKDWIMFDSGGKVSAYAAEIQSGTWGGEIEIKAFVQLKDVNVHVFETCPGGYRRICVFDAGPGDSRNFRTVYLLYQGREHYDSLVLDADAGRWVPRTGMAFHAGA